MPSKAQRAASRQARLSRRRRRGKAAPQNFQAGPTQRPTVSDTSEDSPSPRARQATSFRAQVPASTSSSPSPTMRSRRRRAADAGSSNASRFLSRELRQIGVITSLIAVILVGLTFVLG